MTPALVGADDLPEALEQADLARAEDLRVRHGLPGVLVALLALEEQEAAVLLDQPQADGDDVAEPGVERGAVGDGLAALDVALALEQVAAGDLVDLPREARWDVPDATEYAKRCEQLGADWIDVSSGGVSPQQKITLGPGYQVPFAEQIRKELKIPVIAVGLITEPKQAEEILASGKADLVAIGRGLLWNPRWPWVAAAELDGTVEAPRQYWRSQPRAHMAIFGTTKFGQR